MCIVLTVKNYSQPSYKLQGVPELTNLLFTLSVADHSFCSRLGLNFTVFYTQQNILFTI